MSCKLHSFDKNWMKSVFEQPAKGRMNSGWPNAPSLRCVKSRGVSGDIKGSGHKGEEMGRKRDSGSKLTPLYAWLFIISLGLTVVTVGFQCVAWVQTGEWRSESVLDAVDQVEILRGTESQFFQFREWLDQWSGLRAALDWVPLSGVFAIIGLFWLALAATH